ncbi:MAG: TonB-dependent receptor plug domain-containing protein [Longimicrobiales bacterium]
MNVTHLPAAVASAALLGLLASPAAAQEPLQLADTFQLEELVVTATRLPLPAAALPAAVTVLDGADLRRRGVHHVIDALREVPALHVVQSGSYGSRASIFLRGGESDYVLVLVDGVPINQSGGAVDPSSLTTDQIERIEVVRGPVSVLYGSDAVSGVVQIFTRSGGGRSTVARARAGSYGTWDGAASHTGRLGATHIAAGVSAFRTDGVLDLNNDYRNDAASLRLDYAAPAAVELRFSARLQDFEYHYPTDATGAVVDQNAFQYGQRLVASAEVGHRFGSRTELRATFGTHRLDGGIDDRADGPADTLGFYGYIVATEEVRDIVDARLDLHLGAPGLLTIGVAHQRQEEHSAGESLSQFGNLPSSFGAERDNTGYYAQLVTGLADVTTTGGVRIDDNEAFGTFTTYRVGVAAPLSRALRLRASAGSAFKEPTIFQNFATGFVRGNPDLRPERSHSVELGAELRDRRGHSVAVTVFQQRFRDMIDYNGAAAADQPSYSNVAAARSRGFELESRLRPTGWLGLSGSYSFVAAEVTDSAFEAGADAELATGAALLRRPRQAASLRATLRTADGASVQLTATHTGERVDRDFSSFPSRRVRLEPHTRVDLAGELPVRTRRLPQLTITARAENILDAAYQEVLGFAAPGRALFLGARLAF